MTKKDFGKLVRRAQVGDAVAIRELRQFVDGGTRAAYNGAATRRDGPATMRIGPTAHKAKPQTHLRINTAVLWDVREVLGITKAVSIRWVAVEEIPGRNGEHEYTAEGDHLIRLRVGRSAEDTNRTAVHELEHAAAADGYRNRWRWSRAYDADPQRYEDNAYEVARLLSHMKVVTA